MLKKSTLCWKTTYYYYFVVVVNCCVLFFTWKYKLYELSFSHCWLGFLPSLSLHFVNTVVSIFKIFICRPCGISVDSWGQKRCTFKNSPLRRSFPNWISSMICTDMYLYVLDNKHGSFECVSHALKQCFPKCKMPASDVHDVLGETSRNLF